MCDVLFDSYKIVGRIALKKRKFRVCFDFEESKMFMLPSIFVELD